MNTARLQHLVPSGAIFLLAATIAWLSFTQEPAEAFLFPRVISVFFISLAAWNLLNAALGSAGAEGGVRPSAWLKIAPGFLAMLAYVFFAAAAFGFYASATLTFFILYTLYDPAPFSSAKDWAKRVIVTAAFMAVIYGLFALALQVQTPRGFFV